MTTKSKRRFILLKKQCALSVFIALMIFSCAKSPAPPPAAESIVAAQETPKTEDWPDINLLNPNGYTLLHEAVMNKNLGMAKIFIQQGADVNMFSATQMNPLYYAADCGQVEMVKLLLDAGALIDAKSTQGWSPLSLALYRGHIPVAKELIRRGADVKTANDFGWTAQHSAAAGGHLEISKLLIEKGADVNTEQLSDSVLHWAAIKGHADVATLLIEHGAVVDKRNLTGAMPLHLAISYSHIETVKVLLDKGADPNSVAGNGFTPLLTAYEWPGVKNRETLALLLKLYGAE
jgi:ankyrin repeat protein